MSNEMRGDDLAATGERAVPGESELYADWEARVRRGRGRHAAISRNLATWSNYKSWSEKMRQSFPADVASPTKQK